MMGQQFQCISIVFFIFLATYPLWAFGQKPFDNPKEEKMLYEKHSMHCHETNGERGELR